MQTQPLLAALLALSLLTPAARAELMLPAVFSDHMVLQRELPVRVWGTADAGAAVTVRFADLQATGKAGDDGRWLVTLEPLAASAEGRTLTVESDGERVTIDDVLVGEVWLCGGQSNMEWPVAAAQDGESEIAAADWPMIRLLQVPKTVALEPADDVAAQWEVCSPKTVGRFSAVGYFFGRALHERLDVPIGLMHSSWGGTPAEAWVREDALASDPMTQPMLTHWAEAKGKLQAGMDEFERRRAAGTLPPDRYEDDTPDSAAASKYAEADFDDSAWETARLPGLFDRGDAFDGVVWYRKTIELPSGLRGKPLTLSLGAIDDADRTFVNGTRVGSTALYSDLRVYTVPAALTDGDTLTLAVRVFDSAGGGGFSGKPEQLYLAPETDDAQRVSLAGDWKMHVERKLEPATMGGGPSVPGVRTSHVPAVLHHGMLAPLAPATIRGAIWYQGETNAGRPLQYQTLLPMLIADWRDTFQNPDLYFGIVQLSAFNAVQDQPTDTGWTRLREAQALTAMHDDHAGLAVTIDIGDPEDIHPRNKQDVGKRLAHWALHDVYGEDVSPSGPTLRDFKADGDTVRVRFEHVNGGLKTTDGDAPAAFALAGEDGVYHWAEAKIVGDDTVELRSDAVAKPKHVRYGWNDSPAKVNLVAGNGMPTVPFRTDDTPHNTDGNRY